MIFTKRKPTFTSLQRNNENLALQQVLGGNLTRADAIREIEAYELLLAQGQPIEAPVNHYFGKDIYARELFFKKGTMATGRVQKVDHVSILISGRMTLWTPELGVHEVVGPSITEVKHGMKRAGFAHTDVHWVCAYGIKDAANKTAEELTDILTFRYYGEYQEFIERFTIESKELQWHS